MAVTSETLRLTAGLRAQIAAIVDDQARALVQAWSVAWDEVSADLNAAMTDLAAGAADGTLTRSMALRSVRLQKSLAQIADHLQALAQESGIRIVGDLPQVVRQAGAAQEAIIASQLPSNDRVIVTAWSRVDPGSIEAIVKRSTEQITALSWSISADAYQVVRRELVRGVAAGSNPRETAARMVARAEGGFNGGLSRALTIARTETLDAHRAASALSMNANADTLTGWLWQSALSERTCPACWGMNGTIHDLGEPGPDGHQNCVLPGAIVSGPKALASTTRWFDGEVVELEVSGGHLLTVTPNHPILTLNGWVAAGQLREGDDVFTGSGRELPTVGRGPDDYQIPSLIEDVAQTLGGTLPVDSVSVPTAAEDFHGDGAGSKIHVVRTHRLLLRDDDAMTGQFGSESMLKVRDMGLAQFARHRGLRLGLDGLVRPADRGMGSLSVGSVLFGRSSRSHDLAGRRWPAPRHTCGLESSSDRATRHPVSVGQRIGGLSSQVAGDYLGAWQAAFGKRRGPEVRTFQSISRGSVTPQATLTQNRPEPASAYPMPSRNDLTTFAGNVVTNRVLNIRRRSWSGHVYNIQTETGWYLANGILTHNCACNAVPITKSWRDLGINMDEPASVFPDAQARFADLPDASQLAIMGPQRLGLLRSGDVSFSDLATRTSTAGWRDSWQATPVKDLAAKAAA